MLVLYSLWLWGHLGVCLHGCLPSVLERRAHEDMAVARLGLCSTPDTQQGLAHGRYTEPV